MLTPQEVSARSFTKMVMGGYNMTMVDEFLDELTEDYTTLYKENASLKAKMKVLVEKVEEYRATEDSMRATLLSAQRMADSIVKEAEEKRDEILKQSEATAREKLEEYRKKAEESDARLRRGQEEFRGFIDRTKALCVQQIQFLEDLPGLQVSAPEEETPVAEEIRESILAAEKVEEPAVSEPEPEPTPEPSQTPRETAPAAATPSAEQLLDTLAAAEAPAEDLSATRRVNINELKFGPNYRGGTD